MTQSVLIRSGKTEWGKHEKRRGYVNVLTAKAVPEQHRRQRASGPGVVFCARAFPALSFRTAYILGTEYKDPARRPRTRRNLDPGRWQMLTNEELPGKRPKTHKFWRHGSLVCLPPVRRFSRTTSAWGVF